MKIKGDELQKFLEEAWPGDDWYWDHDLFEEPDLTATYETGDIGPVMYQGREEDPTNGSGYDLAKLIRTWRVSRQYDIFTIQVPKELVESVRQALGSFGIII